MLHMPKLYLPMSVQKTKSEGQMNSALEAYFAAVESEQTNLWDVAGLAVALVLCVWAVS